MHRIHPTALVEEGVTIGDLTSVWDNVHVRRGASIGTECIIGEKSYIAYDVEIGDRVKINAFVYICAAVCIEDGVAISAGTVFTNDRFPRATTDDLAMLRTSDPDEHTLFDARSGGRDDRRQRDDRSGHHDRAMGDGRNGVGRHPVGSGSSPRRRESRAVGRSGLPMRIRLSALQRG